MSKKWNHAYMGQEAEPCFWRKSEADPDPQARGFKQYWETFSKQVRLHAPKQQQLSTSDIYRAQTIANFRVPDPIKSDINEMGAISRIEEFLIQQDRKGNWIGNHGPECEACNMLESPIARLQYITSTQAGVMCVISTFIDYVNKPTETSTLSYCSLLLLDKFIADHSGSFDMSYLVTLVCQSKFPLRTINEIGYCHLFAAKRLLPVSFIDQLVGYFFQQSQTVTDIKCLVLLINIIEDKYPESDLADCYWNRFEILARLGKLDSRVIYEMSQILAMKTMPHTEIFERSDCH